MLKILWKHDNTTTLERQENGSFLPDDAFENMIDYRPGLFDICFSSRDYRDIFGHVLLPELYQKWNNDGLVVVYGVINYTPKYDHKDDLVVLRFQSLEQMFFFKLFWNV